MPKIVVKVNGQSIYSLLQKKQRNVFQSSVPEHSSWHQFCFHALNRRWSDTQTGVSISLTHTRSALNNSHISESTAQVEFYARGFSVHVWSTVYLCMYVRTRGFRRNPNSNTPKLHRKHNDSPTVCVIAQQYSSIT